MVFSHLTRRRPWPAVKIVLAVTVLGVFVLFVHDVLGQAEAGNLASVEGPLAELFLWIQVTHAFDVPARRDLLFSIIASAAFVAVASAQAIQTSFLVLVLAWLLLCVIALALSWQSMSGAPRHVPLATIGVCSLLAAALAALFVAVLPAPHPSQLVTLPSSITTRLELPNQGGLDGGSSGTEPMRPAPPGGPLGVGGFAGFAGNLDTALRGNLGDEVVMRLRANRPGYLEALSYGRWDGQSWLDPPVPHGLVTLDGGSPFQVVLGRNQSGAPSGRGLPSPTPLPLTSQSSLDVETVYVAEPMTNVLVSSPDPLQVWFPAPRLYENVADGSLRSPIAVTPGTVYTVVSSSTQRPPAVLAADRDPASVLAAADPADLELPHPYPTVRALARRITARSPTVYAKIDALESWMSRHVRYSTDIPPLRPGQDAVEQFLFHGRVGFCEQISTAMAVMLRSLGIPAREVTGFVPGPYNPITDLYEIQARDAHAWVKVWFPGYGWQSFDPTADVPLANPSPGSVIAADVGRFLTGLPWAPIGGSLAACLAAALGLRAVSRRPRTWAERVARRIERAGASWGVERSPSETLWEYADRLPPAAVSPRAVADGTLAAGVAVLERAAYGGEEPDEPARRAAEQAARSLRSRGVRRLVRRAGRSQLPRHPRR
jgi:transglutaminase-like putative cysteine protease